MLCDDLEAKCKILIFCTEVHWLSKGDILCSLCELKEEVALFLECGANEQLLEVLRSLDII
jgi:hypothetical protein